VSTITIDQTGNLTFQSTLLTTGRTGGASTAPSSTCDLGTGSLAYTILYKCVGGITGVDATPAVQLKNGKPGQILTLYVYSVVTNGLWNVGVVTSLSWSNLQFNAVGDQATLLYLDDTTGWIILSTTSVTVTPKVQGGLTGL
jgi:hypothetical protein